MEDKRIMDAIVELWNFIDGRSSGSRLFKIVVDNATYFNLIKELQGMQRVTDPSSSKPWVRDVMIMETEITTPQIEKQKIEEAISMGLSMSKRKDETKGEL